MKLTRFKVAVSGVLACSSERAFKTPMLCDVSRIHTGYGLMPRITHTSEDQHWGQPGSTKKVFAAPSWTQKGGYVSMDKVIDRIENKYWKIEVSEFQAWMLGFVKFEGEWETTEIKPGHIRVDYTYTLYARQVLLYPLQWLFAHGFWKLYMKHVMENIRTLVEKEEPYLYA